MIAPGMVLERLDVLDRRLTELTARRDLLARGPLDSAVQQAEAWLGESVTTG